MDVVERTASFHLSCSGLEEGASGLSRVNSVGSEPYVADGAGSQRFGFLSLFSAESGQLPRKGPA